MDIPVKGYVAGENGDSRIRGVVIDRAGAVVRQAAIGGFLSGVAEFITRSNTNSNVTFEPNSGLAKFSAQCARKPVRRCWNKARQEVLVTRLKNTLIFISNARSNCNR